MVSGFNYDALLELTAFVETLDVVNNFIVSGRNDPVFLLGNLRRLEMYGSDVNSRRKKRLPWFLFGKIFVKNSIYSFLYIIGRL